VSLPSPFLTPAQPFAAKGSERSDSETRRKNFSVVICIKASPCILPVSMIRVFLLALRVYSWRSCGFIFRLFLVFSQLRSLYSFILFSKNSSIYPQKGIFTFENK
jgi:hypothetical protein